MIVVGERRHGGAEEGERVKKERRTPANEGKNPERNKRA